MDSTYSDVTQDDDPEVDDLHRKIVKNIKDSRRHYAEWRDEAKEAYDFYAGNQWTQEDIDILVAQGRPPVVFNRVARTVNSVTGLEVQNRQEVNYFPRQLGSAGKSEMLTGAAKWSRDECGAEDEESEAFEDTIICGMGWTETRLDYETDPEGVIIIDRFDPMEGIVDHTCKKRNCDDSRFRGRLKTYTVEEFKEKWPDAEIPRGRFFDSDEEERQVQDLSPGGYSPVNQDETNDKRPIQVCQYQYYETTKIRMVQGEDGRMVEMPEDQFKQRKPIIDAAGWNYTKQAMPKRKYMQCFLTPEGIIEKGECAVNNFTLHVITGLRDRNKNTWFGIVGLMKDPQRWANKWLSQIQHILNTQAKSGKLLWETGAFKNPRKAKEEWASPDAMAELNAGGLQKIEQIKPAAYPEGIDRMLQYALQSVNDVPGVNLELMGLANRDQANVLEQSRKQAGVTILAKFFDSLRRYRKKQGAVHAEFIQQYISDGRLIRVSGELGPKYVQLIRDPNMIKYDVVVDDAPTSTNMKEKTFAALQSIMPMVLQEKIPVPPDLLDYTPLPEDLIQKWKQYINEQGQNPEVQQAKQIQQEGSIAEVQAKKSQAMLNAAKAQKELKDIAAPNIDMEKQAQEMQLKREELAANIALKREELASNIALKREDMLMRHSIAAENNKMAAEASSRPTTTVQFDAQDSLAETGEIIKEMAASMAMTSQQNNEALSVLLKNSADTNQMLAAAITTLGQPKIGVAKKDAKGNTVVEIHTASPGSLN